MSVRKNGRTLGDGTSPLSGITFGAYDFPVVEAGVYGFTLEQDVDQGQDGTWQGQHEVTVEAPRFRLPEDGVRFRSPANAATGDYRTVLASVVFSDPKLPWLRRAVPPGYPQDTAAPWMALTLFAPSELPRPEVDSGGILSVDPMTRAAGISITRFRALSGQPASHIGLAQSGKLVVPDLPHGSALIHDDEATCMMIAVPAAQVAASFPKWQEMPYLAQTRTAEDGAHQSALICNRFSQPVDGIQPYVRIAHVVSVENMWSLLDGTAAGGAALQQHVADDDVICFLVMTSWSFQNGGPDVRSDHFEPLARHLVQTPDGAPRVLSYTHPVARTDLSAQPQRLQDRFASGYMPLSARLVTQETTFCWYRGPLVPFRTEPFDPATEHVVLADRYSDALVYDVEDGVFDLSRSGAWQIGRVMALADQELMTSWAQVLRSLRTTVEQEMRQARIGARAEGNPTRAFLDTVRKHGLSLDPQAGFAAPHPRQRRQRRARLRVYPTRAETRAAIARLGTGGLTEGVESEALDRIVEKVARLMRLDGIPFHMLAPEPGYLPEESLRAFNLDADWLSFLMDGVLSLGLRKGVDHALYETLRAEIWSRATQRAFGVEAGQGSFLASGVVMRSYIDTAWDDLMLRAFRRDASAPGGLREIDVWHEARQDGSLRMWFFLDRPDVIVLAPPVGRLHMGVSETQEIQLRNLDASKGAIGAVLDGVPPVDAAAHLRGDGLTLRWWAEDGSGLVQSLAQALADAGQPAAHPADTVPLPPQALAIELIVATPALELSTPDQATSHGMTPELTSPPAPQQETPQ